MEIISGATIPADHEDGEVGGCEGCSARKKVEAMCEQHRGFSPKTASRVKSRTYLHLCYKYELWGKVFMTHGGGLLVIGETPDEAADDVANPENCLDQHRLVVFLAHPVVLKGQ